MTRYAEVPSVLAEWIDRWSRESLEASTAELIEAGCRALDAALSLPVRDRRAAQALLAADASLTAAVGRISEEADPAEAFLAMIDRVADEPADTKEGV